MLKPLYRKRSFELPEVVLDKENGNFIFSGNCIPEDSYKFFVPLLEWFSEYIKAPLASTEFHIQQENISSSSAKLFLDLIWMMRKIPKPSIVWYFIEGDEDMFEIGEEYTEMLNIPFEFKKIPY